MPFLIQRGKGANMSMYWQKLPPFFRDNPDLHCKFVKYCVSNLQDLTITLARDYVCKKLIPAAMKKHEVIVNDDTLQLQQNAEQQDLLKDLHGISELPGCTTIYDWLVKCGFQYKALKKCFFVDTHESDSNHHYWKLQMKQYLQHECWMHRWFQMPLTRADDRRYLINMSHFHLHYRIEPKEVKPWELDVWDIIIIHRVLIRIAGLRLRILNEKSSWHGVKMSQNK